MKQIKTEKFTSLKSNQDICATFRKWGRRLLQYWWQIRRIWRTWVIMCWCQIRGVSRAPRGWWFLSRSIWLIHVTATHQVTKRGLLWSCFFSEMSCVWIALRGKLSRHILSCRIPGVITAVSEAESIFIGCNVLQQYAIDKQSISRLHYFVINYACYHIIEFHSDKNWGS